MRDTQFPGYHRQVIDAAQYFESVQHQPPPGWIVVKEACDAPFHIARQLFYQADSSITCSYHQDDTAARSTLAIVPVFLPGPLS